MGATFSPTVANIYMSVILRNFLNTQQQQPLTTLVSHEHVVAIAETLSEGAKYLEERDIDYTPSVELQTALVASAVQLGDVELAELVLSFVDTFETPESERLVEALEDTIATKKEKTSDSRER